jgi:hypothetical protein
MYNSLPPVRAVARGTLMCAPGGSGGGDDDGGGDGGGVDVSTTEERVSRVAASVVSAAVAWTGAGDPSSGGMRRRASVMLNERLVAWREKWTSGSVRVAPATPGQVPAWGVGGRGRTAAAAAAGAGGLSAATDTGDARRRRWARAQDSASRKRVVVHFFETESFTAGAFFSRRMLRISLVQAYYNPFVVTLMGCVHVCVSLYEFVCCLYVVRVFSALVFSFWRV